MKAWFVRHRPLFAKIALLLVLHEVIVRTLAGRDVIAVLLAPNPNTPFHWAVLAGLLLVTRLLLLLVVPGFLVWRFTQPAGKNG